MSRPARSAMMSNPSEPIRTHPCGSRQLTQNRRIWSSIAAILRGVNTRDISPRNIVWMGGSSNIITPLGMSKSDFTSSRMSPRIREGCPVRQRRLDVCVTRQGPEAVARVVMERRFFAKARVDRVRVGGDVDVGGVVIDVPARGKVVRDCHRLSRDHGAARERRRRGGIPAGGMSMIVASLARIVLLERRLGITPRSR